MTYYKVSYEGVELNSQFTLEKALERVSQGLERGWALNSYKIKKYEVTEVPIRQVTKVEVF